MRAGTWVARSGDPADCDTGIEAGGACTSTLQCEDGVWVDRFDDPSACL